MLYRHFVDSILMSPNSYNMVKISLSTTIRLWDIIQYSSSLNTIFDTVKFGIQIMIPSKRNIKHFQCTDILQMVNRIREGVPGFRDVMHHWTNFPLKTSNFSFYPMRDCFEIFCSICSIILRKTAVYYGKWGGII